MPRMEEATDDAKMVVPALLKAGRGGLRMDAVIRVLALMALTLITEPVARAAELSGVQIPDAQSVDGTTMRLNGIGLRTYSFLRVPIYVAGLYLEQPSNNPDAILHSRSGKLLDIRFLRDIDADEARKAWREGLENNCKSPCSLDPVSVKRFLSAVPSMHKGDGTTLLFTPRGVEFKINGASMGVIADPHFAEVILATFIGPEPPTARLKHELLGGPG